MNPRRLAAAAVAILLFAAAPPAAAGPWFEEYHEAERAVASRRWELAVEHLRAALADRPDSAARARTYGMRFVDYFPYLQLGIAYRGLGRPGAALQAFESELSQGAIQQVPARLRELQTLIEAVEKEVASARLEESTRGERLIAEGLSRAARQEEAGDLDAAADSLDRVLALAPESEEALAAAERVRAARAERQRRIDARERAGRLRLRGGEELSRGDPRAAAASFGEAEQLFPTDEGARGLEEARSALAGQLRRSAAPDPIPGRLDRARAFEAEGRWLEAIREVQSVLALQPGHEEALEFEERLARLRADDEAERESGRQVSALLETLRTLRSAGDLAGTLRAANRILVLDPGHGEALTAVAEAHSRLGEQLLVVDGEAPVIVIDGAGAPGEEWIVSEGSGWLAGRVLDATPVELVASIDGQDHPVEVSEVRMGGIWVSDFRVAAVLDPGVSTVRVEARDLSGRETTLEREVEYRRSLLRSRGLFGIAALCLALAGSGALAWRFLRRRALLRRRFNPYVAGAPILDGERYYGRRKLLDYVLRRISNNSVMLYGERRIGKTSFQHQLKRCLGELDDPDHEFFPVFVDLQGIPQERFFATLATEVFHELGPRLGGLEPDPSLATGEYGYRTFVRDLQKTLAALQERNTKKVKLVLLIDEVDELNDYDPRVNQRLRSLFMRSFSDRLVAVVSGVTIKKQWEREGSPWYNFFQEVEVEPLGAGEARALIEAPVAGIFRFEEAAALEIVERTRSKPYLIQRLCSSLIDRMHEEGRRTVGIDDVEAACAAEGL